MFGELNVASKLYPPPFEDTAIRTYTECARILGCDRKVIRIVERRALHKLGLALVRMAKRNGTTVAEMLED